ncbi:MAG: HAD family hydrolase [Pseudomonadota bacterium]
MTRTIRIGMWSGPRNTSSTMMRAFENRRDTSVVDEPFYAYYLAESGADHPMREAVLADMPQSWDAVVAGLNGPAPDDAPVAFHKHIAYHCAPTGGGVETDVNALDFSWTDDQRAFLLIRDPRKMVASFAKKFADVGPIARSLAVQRKILSRREAIAAPCPVVDADDILRDPRGMLSALCAAIDIPFSDDMLVWPPGRRESDGVWAPHWYDAVETSTGFRPYEDRAIDLTPDLQAIAEACAPSYRALFERRLRPGA